MGSRNLETVLQEGNPRLHILRTRPTGPTSALKPRTRGGSRTEQPLRRPPFRRRHGPTRRSARLRLSEPRPGGRLGSSNRGGGLHCSSHTVGCTVSMMGESCWGPAPTSWAKIGSHREGGEDDPRRVILRSGLGNDRISLRGGKGRCTADLTPMGRREGDPRRVTLLRACPHVQVASCICKGPKKRTNQQAGFVHEDNQLQDHVFAFPDSRCIRKGDRRKKVEKGRWRNEEGGFQRNGEKQRTKN